MIIKTTNYRGIIIILLFMILHVHGQEENNHRFLIMNYNVENFFDCVHDSLKNDNEFLPTGIRAWNSTKYYRKQANIAKVITAIGGWNAPELIGICEVENEKCMRDLTKFSGLSHLQYKYLHHDSPDPRGIDVALLYQPQRFKIIHDEAIPIHFQDEPNKKTRDILFASGIIATGDTLHLFICHFPSRLGGEMESEDQRFVVASVLRTKVDSIFAATAKPNIVIMGDFNDYPTNRSILNILKANPLSDNPAPDSLYNLMYKLHTEGKGSNKHNGEWGALDQIIISGNLLNQQNTFFTTQTNAHFFDASFLLENDKTFLGKQPFRTYVGMKYQGGYSDHLPVYAEFVIKTSN